MTNTIIEFKKEQPSLVALKTSQNTKRLDGIRVSDVCVRAVCGEFERVECGEVLFKEHGLSGIVIFNLSSLFAKNSCFEGKISINLLKNFTKTQIFQMLIAKVNIFKTAHLLLESMFAKELANEILLRSKIDFDAQTNKFSKTDFEKLVQTITNFEFDVCGHYDNNQVWSGGVKLDALSKNLESTTKCLYFSGEVCDIDAVCGGFNLSWAWSSANAIAKKIGE